ncbi:MAG: DUF58 domain-containing protein [Anaerolineae bacterium]|nr:DUF58 domain-containing protein [Anaerolineae bacterium]
MRSFLPFLLILFIIAAVLRVDFFFTIVYLLSLVYLLSRLWVRHSLTRLQVQRRFVDHAFSGDVINVEVRIRNASRLPIPWLELHESLPVELSTPPFYSEVISIGGRSYHHFHYYLNCYRRGYYTIGPLTLQSGDLLGVAGRAQLEIASEHLIVYPQILPLQELGLPTHSPLAVLRARSPLFEDPARVTGVRDYQRGDSIRRIHWTATASAGHLLVKQYHPAIARETFICLDLNRQGYGQRQRYTATELAIVAAASLANHIIVKEGLPAGLSTEAWDPLLGQRARFSLPPRAERSHLVSLLEVLARVQVTDTSPFEELLRQESLKLPWGATIAVITGRESEPLFDHLVYLRHSGFAVALLLVQPGYPSPELRKRADLLGIPVYRVWKAEELDAALQETRR